MPGGGGGGGGGAPGGGGGGGPGGGGGGGGPAPGGRGGGGGAAGADEVGAAAFSSSAILAFSSATRGRREMGRQGGRGGCGEGGCSNVIHKSTSLLVYLPFAALQFGQCPHPFPVVPLLIMTS